MTKKVKLADLAKDLNVASQEIIDFLSQVQETETKKKVGTVLTEEELNIVLEQYTQKNEVKDFNDYFNSKNEKKKNNAKEVAVEEKSNVNNEKHKSIEPKKAEIKPQVKKNLK